ncbi:MAG: sulfurtransferase [Steroidobacteraceae bacterium]
MNTRQWNTLITATELHEHLHDANLVIVDCRFTLSILKAADKSQAGRQAYQAGHIPGAVYAHLDEDLSGPITATSGRHPLPNVKQLCAKLGSWGIDRSKQVVAYDADNGAMAAARLWWLLRWLGHAQVAVLNGGLKHWQASGFELSTSEFEAAPVEFHPDINRHWLVDADTAGKLAQQSDWRVLDARAPERYAGEVEPLDPVAGHVPGALNYPFARNLTADGRFLPAAQLREQFKTLLGDVAPTHIVGMCGSGVTACHTLLALEAAGLHGAKLYAGSWSEWSKDSQRPVATGHQP